MPHETLKLARHSLGIWWAEMQGVVGQRLQRVLRSKFLNDLGWYGGSTLMLQAARFILSLLVARRVGPDVWGIWAILGLVLMYFPNANLGTLNAMNHDLPIFKGRGDLQRVRQVRGNVLAFMTIGAGIGAVGVTAYALLWSAAALKLGLLLIVPLLVLNQFWLWVQFSLKSDNRFVSLGQQQMVFAVLLLLGLPLALTFGLEGFIIAQVLATAFALAWGYFTRGFTLEWRLEWPEIVRLMRVGLPILAVGLLYLVLTTMDRWLIAGQLGLKSLGFYAFAMTLTMVVQLAPSMVADQVYTRMLEVWGATGKVAGVRSWMWRQVQLSLGAVLLTAIGSALILPWLVRTLFPEYIPSLEPFMILLLFPVGLAIMGGPANLLNTINHQYHYLFVQVLALPVMWLFGSLLLRFGFAMTGVAWAVVLTFIVYGLILLGVAVAVSRNLENRHGT